MPALSNWRLGFGRRRPARNEETPRWASDDPVPYTDDDLDRRVSASLRRRRVLIRILVAVFLISPDVNIVAHGHLTGREYFLLPASLVFAVLMDRVGIASFSYPEPPDNRAWRLLPVMTLLGGAIFVAGGMNWLTSLALTAAVFGRFASRSRIATFGMAACSVLGLGVGLTSHIGFGGTVSAALVPLLAGLVAFGMERRNLLMYRLSMTRAELARVAVAEERLRIARDLHDLLGHSLSLIALKAELAGRVIGDDPARAAREIADLEAVTRRSLTEVRQAVTSYRQPSLAAELAAARRILASAGIDCRLAVPGTYALPPEADALAAWTVREGATNIVRHSGARRAEISLGVTESHVWVSLSDDGAGPGGQRAATAGTDSGDGVGPTARPVSAGGGGTGSGLAGLAERASRLGGTLTAGAGPGGGFRLHVIVPLTAPAGTHALPSEPAATGPATTEPVTTGPASPEQVRS